MDLFRLILFCGLVFHKFLWEVLKRKGQAAGVQPRSRPPGNWLVKLIKGTVLVFLLIQALFLDLFPISDEPDRLRLVGFAIFFLGLFTAVIGRLQRGKNWIDLEDYQILSNQSLVISGIYRYIRHPIYTGDILLLLGLELALNSWLVLGVAIPVLISWRQALAEESLLSIAFPDYPSYCKNTKRFIPFVV